MHLTTDTGSFHYPIHTEVSLQSVNSSHLLDTPSPNNAQNQNPFLNQQLDDTGSQRPSFHLDQVNPSFSHIIQPPANHTLKPPSNHTILLPANHTIQPSANHTQQPPSNHTIQLPANHTQQPPANHTQQPPANHTQQPANHTIQPPANHTIQPPANHTIQPPANHTIQPPANHTIQPPANHTIQPPASHTIQPPANHTIQPPANQTIQPPVNHTIQPPANHTIQPPASHTILPPANHTIQPPVNHTLQPPANHTLQISNSPQYPVYADVQERINSFLCWPTHHCHNPVNLAEAGFFYQDVADSVTCFYCGLALRYWRPHDDIVDKHHQHQPQCQHVLQILQKLRKKLLKRIRMKPDDGLISVEVPLLTTKDAVMQDYPDVHGSQTGSCVKFSILERENKILKDKLTCKMCKAAPANEMTLPCGHLVACQKCVRLLRDCVSCHNTIIASVTVYLV